MNAVVMKNELTVGRSFLKVLNIYEKIIRDKCRYKIRYHQIFQIQTQLRFAN